jgi:ferric-dicitrate binding protein FerR (iron transport regulator)
LPDGSLVTLNKYSSLQFPGQFGDHSRVVYLKGEGFFQVVNQVRQPFIVKMNGVTIRDLGTSFNVRAGNGETEIIVETGEVQVESGPYVVKAGAGEKVIVGNSRTGSGQAADGLYPRKTAAADELYQYYRTKQFICRNTPLGKLTEVLNEAYDVHIVIEGQALRDLPLTATFRNESLDSVLSVVARTFGLTLSRNGQEIMLKQ